MLSENERIKYETFEICKFSKRRNVKIWGKAMARMYIEALEELEEDRGDKNGATRRFLGD